MICNDIESFSTKEKCNEYIKELVIDEGILLSGHYKLNESISARDWINLDGLFALPNEKFLDPISRCIENIIDLKKEELCLIGINYYGAIMASILGYKYELPFSYCFDDNKIVDNSEKEIKKLEVKHLLLITGVIIYGNSICNLIYRMYKDELINWNTEIEVIVMFERRINKKFFANVYANENVKRVYVLNDDFDIEICQKNRHDCLFRKNKKINKYKNQVV